MVQMSKTYLHKSTWIILKSIMLNRDSIQLQEPGSGRKGNGGIGALVVFFNIYFFKEKLKQMWQAVVIYQIWVLNTYLLFSVVF